MLKWTLIGMIGAAALASPALVAAQDYYGQGYYPQYRQDYYQPRGEYRRGYYPDRYAYGEVPFVKGHPAYDEYGPDPNGTRAPDGHRIKCKLVDQWDGYSGRYVRRRDCW